MTPPAVAARGATAHGADTLVVVRGAERAYARVPATIAPAVVERLAAAGQPARAVPAARAWLALPSRTRLLIYAVVIAGFGAADAAAPALWWTTPLVAALLLTAATRAMRRPLLPESALGGRPLPTAVQQAATVALAGLPDGDARSLLADVVRHAELLLASLDPGPDDERLSHDVAELVAACCTIARDHAQLEQFLCGPAVATGERDRDGNGDRDAELHARCATARDTLGHRLRDASAALTALHAQSVASGSIAAERVTELALELASEARVRGEAAAEIERLLAPRGASGRSGVMRPGMGDER